MLCLFVHDPCNRPKAKNKIIFFCLKKKYKKHDFSFQSGPNLMSFALRGGVWGKKSQVLKGNFGIGPAGSFFPSSDPQGEKGFLQPCNEVRTFWDPGLSSKLVTKPR